MAQVAVSGNVYEQDAITPIEAAAVSFSGISESGDTVAYQFVTDVQGYYSDNLVAGTYRVWASAEGYADVYLTDSLLLLDGQVLEAVNFILHESYHPVRYLMSRTEAVRSLSLEDEVAKLESQGIVHAIRGQKDLEEAAGAYKNIDEVMAAQTDLVKIVTELSPVAVIKG